MIRTVLVLVATLAGCSDEDVRADLGVADLQGADLAAADRPGAMSCADASGTPAPDGGGIAPRRVPMSCTTADIDGYIAACLAPETALVIKCQQFAAAHPTCIDCLRTADGRGPLVERPGGVDINFAGCLELSPGSAGAACDPCTDQGDLATNLRAVAPLFCL